MQKKRRTNEKYFMRTHYKIEKFNLIPKRNRTKTKTHLSDERTEWFFFAYIYICVCVLQKKNSQ